ncbi:sensor histidine kinase [Actinoplanes sp. NPDC049265]|uniref:sensor histidine kinase n=1 Tax=Actinoplanes sp. NPDC049265 TaxID=3363902 RepID=UPI0037179DEA
MSRTDKTPGLGLSGLIPDPRLRFGAAAAGLAVSEWMVLTTAAPGVVVPVGAGLAGLCWLCWLLGAGGPPTTSARPGGPGRAVLLAVMGAAGGAVAGVEGFGLIFVGVMAAAAATEFDLLPAAGLAVAAPVGAAGTLTVRGDLPGNLSQVVLVAVAGLVVAAGRRQAAHRATQRALLATADRQAEVALREAELAAERNRLARELHDVLAHTLGALSIQLTAVQTVARGGAGRDELLRQIDRSRELVGEGLDEAHQAVRALRADSLPLSRQIERLCDRHACAFDSHGSELPLPAEATLALYRVAQEALTNAEKHAPGAAVRVSLTFTAQEVIVSVGNDAPGLRPEASSGGGFGLPGMRQRMRLVGGRCDFGPDDVGGWRVTASLPTAPNQAAALPTEPAREEERA